MTLPAVGAEEYDNTTRSRGDAVQIVKNESGEVLKIAGTLEIDAAEELRDALRDFIREARRPIVDLSAVEACDAIALQLLCSARKTAVLSDKQFELIGVSEAVLDAGAALGVRFSDAPTKAAVGLGEDVPGVTPAK